MDMGAHFRIDPIDPTTGLVREPVSAALIAKAFPVMKFYGTDGKTAVLLKDGETAPGGTRTWSCHAATSLRVYIPYTNALNDIITEMNVEATTSWNGGTKKTMTSCVCDGQRIIQIRDKATGQMMYPKEMPCRAFSEPDCLVDGKPVKACSKCKSSLSVILQAPFGLIKVRSSSGRDRRELPEMIVRLLEEYGPNIVNIPLVLSRRAQPVTKNYTDRSGNKKSIQTTDWFFSLAIEPEFAMRLAAAKAQFMLRQMTGGEPVLALGSGGTVPQITSPVDGDNDMDYANDGSVIEGSARTIEGSERPQEQKQEPPPLPVPEEPKPLSEQARNDLSGALTWLDSLPVPIPRQDEAAIIKAYQAWRAKVAPNAQLTGTPKEIIEQFKALVTKMVSDDIAAQKIEGEKVIVPEPAS